MKHRSELGCVAVVAVLCLLLPAAIAGAEPAHTGTAPTTVIRVPADQPTIQAGIDMAVDGDTVLVANGIYSGSGNSDIDFEGRAITVRSENGPAACVVDCEDTARGFIFQSGEGPNAVLQGFTIRDGWAGPGEYGGAIHCQGSSPTITGNIITGSRAQVGGGIYCTASSPLITDNTITGNTANNRGAGIACNHSATPVITGNVITGNEASNFGGGIDCYDSPAVISSNTISGNSAGTRGGGIHSYHSDGSISGNSITGNSAVYWGGGISCHSSSPPVLENTITDNTADYGGGISCEGSVSLIDRNTITDNEALTGGGIHCTDDSHVAVNWNVIHQNSATTSGGGMSCSGSSPSVFNNVFTANTAAGTYGGGGGLTCASSSAEIKNCTFSGNTASNRGGGILFSGGQPIVENCIIWGNSAADGNELFVGYYFNPCTLTIRYSDVEGGQTAVFVDLNCSLDWGPGMIDADPLFVSGPSGGHYLSQTAAGQAADSPCVDAGDPIGELIEGTTRTDGVWDLGLLDMGYHYTLDVPWRLVAGPGPGYDNPPLVRVFPPLEDAEHQHEFAAYGAPHYGTGVSCGDVDGNGVDEIITGAGPGPIYGPHVRGFRWDGTPLAGLSFLAYGTPRWGVNAAAGDLDGDGFDEIITGAGPGAVFGPHVRAFDYDGGPEVTPVPGVSFFAYATLRWGVNVAGGDIDGDGFDEIITGAGPGEVFGTHVRGWNVDGGTATAISGLSFFAYDALNYGVTVTVGDVDGDGMDEIITAPGPSPAAPAHIRGWDYDGSQVTSMLYYNFLAWWPAQSGYGARIFSGFDLDEDGRDELAAGPGPDPATGTPVKVFIYDGSRVTLLFSLQAFPAGTTHGANVAAGRF